MESHTHTPKNDLRVCDCFAVWELESSGYLVHQDQKKKKKKKGALLRLVGAFMGRAYPAVKGFLLLWSHGKNRSWR